MINLTKVNAGKIKSMESAVLDNTERDYKRKIEKLTYEKCNIKNKLIEDTKSLAELESTKAKVYDVLISVINITNIIVMFSLIILFKSVINFPLIVLTGMISSFSTARCFSITEQKKWI